MKFTTFNIIFGCNHPSSYCFVLFALKVRNPKALSYFSPRMSLIGHLVKLTIGTTLHQNVAIHV